MSRVARTSRTTDLGLRILAGEERRRVIEHVAIGRAEFEVEYAGRPLVAFDRDEVGRAVRRYLGETSVNVSDELVRDCQRAVPRWRRTIERMAAEEATA